MAERNLLCSALILAAVFCTAVADEGQRRSDDANALQPVVERLSQDMVAVQGQLTAQSNLIEAQRQRIAALEGVSKSHGVIGFQVEWLFVEALTRVHAVECVCVNERERETERE